MNTGLDETSQAFPRVGTRHANECACATFNILVLLLTDSLTRWPFSRFTVATIPCGSEFRKFSRNGGARGCKRCTIESSVDNEMKKAAKTIRVVYQLNVTLRNVHPPVWRRVQVWEDATLVERPPVQLVMGLGTHGASDRFKIGETDYGTPSPDDEFLGRPVIDEPMMQNVVHGGTQFDSWCDFGATVWDASAWEPPVA